MDLLDLGEKSEKKNEFSSWGLLKQLSQKQTTDLINPANNTYVATLSNILTKKSFLSVY